MGVPDGLTEKPQNRVDPDLSLLLPCQVMKWFLILSLVAGSLFLSACYPNNYGYGRGHAHYGHNHYNNGTNWQKKKRKAQQNIRKQRRRANRARNNNYGWGF